MTEEPNNRRGNSPKGGPPDRFQPKVLIIWIGLIALIIGLWSMVSPVVPSAKQWSVNDVIQAAKNDRIHKLVAKPDQSAGDGYYRLTGELKRPLIETSEQRTEESEEPQNATTGEPIRERFQALGKLTDDRFNYLASEERSYEFKELPSSSLMRDFLLSMVPFILIIALLYFLFVRQLRMAGKGAMNFGKSKAKMLTRDRDKITFDNVAGCDEAKQDVVEIIDFLKDPKKFQKIGGRVPKGILMVGPPGTGKTLLAKAVAGEAEVPFFSISGSDFVEMFVGVGAARVRDMFEQGRKNAPCIIFIDEIDAVGRQRGAGLGGGNDEREQTLNSLLVEMDGFDAHEGVIIIAATNRPDVLDNALLRPGRFDRQVMIDLPDMEGRAEILKVHAKKIKLDEAVNLKDVARNAPGFSGADLENLLNEGALIAARRNKKRVDRFDIEEAREKIAFGTERRKLMDDEDKRMTAYHEAGHALVQVKVDDGNLPLHKVTIIPRGRALGMTMMMPKKDLLGRSKTQLLNQICMAMAGRIGEEVATGDFSNGASGDIKQATKIARHMVCDWGMSELGPVALGENQDHIFLGREISRNQNYSEATAHEIDKAIHHIIDEQYQRAKQIIDEHKEALEIIAQALLSHETIDGKHVQEILEHGHIVSPIREQELEKKPDDAAAKEEAKTAKDKGEELGPGTEPAGAPA